MPYKFNPITGKLDLVDSGSGSCLWEMTTASVLQPITSSLISARVKRITEVDDPVEELDAVNYRTFLYLAPANAGTLEGQDLTIYSGTTKYSGYLSYSTTSTYKAGDPAGSYVNYIVKDASFILQTPNTSSRINKGDEGELDFYINDSEVGTFDLAAAFDEGERAGVQSYPPSTSADGYVTVQDVRWYNSFPAWQKCVARMNVAQTDCREGYNKMHLVHDLSTDQTSNDFDIYYDTDTGSNPSVNTPSFTENSAVTKYLSGINFYTTGSTFDLSVVGSDCFDNVYVLNPITYANFSGIPNGNIPWNDPSVSGLSNPPAINETMTCSAKTLTISTQNLSTINTHITCTPHDPYGSYSSANSSTQNYLVDTYGTNSTVIYEYFNDENRRMPTGSYDTVPTQTTGLWTSSNVLSNGNSQVYLGRLYYPTVDFSSGYLPTQQTGSDYSGFTGDQIYYRCFIDDGTPHSNGILEFGNLVDADIGESGSGNVNVFLKLPTQTGWMDLGKDYVQGEFTGADGDGIKTAQSGDDWSWTCGTFSSVNSGYMYVLRIHLKNSTKYITQVRETDW